MSALWLACMSCHLTLPKNNVARNRLSCTPAGMQPWLSMDSCGFSPPEVALALYACNAYNLCMQYTIRKVPR